MKIKILFFKLVKIVHSIRANPSKGGDAKLRV